ncbi:MAG TPA: AarF/UbiB family protein, partial [archaeon]|nr:AarF/UbiB family protein [archaeon]
MGTASLVIPGFEDATRIANGGSSTIYRARLFSGEDVAVKVAKPGYEERIRKEYSTQYDLSNP